MSSTIPIEWRDAPQDSLLVQAITALVATQRTLEDVVRAGLAQSPPLLVRDVVIQDEYTHDVVMPHSSGVFLVYDTT